MINAPPTGDHVGLRQGEVDHSVATAGEVLVLAQPIGTSRCVRQIGDPHRRLQTHLKVKGVEQFLSNVRAAA
ncbi:MULTISPECIES: hypothetical protein [Streptomyces]|uniref:Uncharacterized protein n=1 Tax=Streptomyces siderophoricus TaxID=2802281 RepID=A0ABS1MZU0_9ACTN|nr:hypothetical protein [Streptomyces sp. 9-7]MBL1093308.1 hypothetical protein [Streptomyces sp. 9-7]